MNQKLAYFLFSLLFSDCWKDVCQKLSITSLLFWVQGPAGYSAAVYAARQFKTGHYHGYADWWAVDYYHWSW